jgi:two-component system cell cycle response regulator
MDGGEPVDRRADERVGLATILVVDDSTAIRRILRRALQGAGYRVTEAADGRAALTACHLETPDLVLLDVDMPVMDGPTALAAMRREPALVDVPVLFLTARTSGADVAAGLRLGAQDYLRKPCDPEELTARVANALHQKVERDSFERKAVEADRLSTVDVLTGLPNRRLLQMRTEEMLVAGGSGTPAALLMIDVDRFKQVNDTEGHTVGDLVLRILAGRLSTVAHNALLTRWGGEEFVVLLPPIVDAAELAAIGERFRAAVDATPFSIDKGRLLDITISVGAASGRLGAFDAMLQAADEALYMAKRSGRNRVVTRTT